ncbi:protein TonB [Granulicella rosea]|uniref:Protein TonB n=1 Tax=Granulicella rosea TaxID=474952 RepID=A0A239J7W4_9BACT|nr:TonB family protein [Granulicella rosea]SNT01957.1 protein TonB [Granulicella rosea]
MPTLTLKTRSPKEEESLGSSFAGALVLHAAILGSILGWSLLSHHDQHWGDNASQAGAVQAQMVEALPLPPKVKPVQDQVLASDTPSVAPPKPEPKTEPPPKPNEVLIPDKVKPQKPLPKAEKPPAPEPPKHVQPPPPPTPKATSGDSSGMRIAQVTQQTKSGTSTVNVQERSFGDRFPYYVQAVGGKINRNWIQQEADSRASLGKKVSISFIINADGSVRDVAVASRSGSPTLDLSAVRALQRIDTFGPLPQPGLDHVTVEYTFIPQ